jgi:hypothetical protein
MAWGEINGLLLVSGLGMFDKETVIEAGGYSHRLVKIWNSLPE